MTQEFHYRRRHNDIRYKIHRTDLFAEKAKDAFLLLNVSEELYLAACSSWRTHTMIAYQAKM